MAGQEVAVRIAMFTNSYPPATSGVATSVKTLVDGCLDRFYPTIVITPGLDGGWAHPLPEVLAVPALTPLNDHIQFAAPNAAKITARLKKFQPDVIHTHQPHLLAYTAAQVAMNLRRPLVLTWHTDYHGIVKGATNSQIAANAAELSALAYAKLCSVVVVVPSRAVAKLLKDMGLSRIAVVPNGVTEQSQKITGPMFRARHNIPADALVVGHVGRLSPEKNPQALAEVFRNVPNAVVLVVGDGPSKALLEKALPSARFTGFLKGDELHGAYTAMDCFVTTSRCETDGLVVKEALTAGTPVLAYAATPGIQDNVREGLDGFLCDTRKGLAKVLHNLCTNRPRLQLLARNARAGAGRFSRKIFVDKMLYVYEHITGTVCRKEHVA